MSESQVSPAVIRRTQELLGKYVKNPALSEKLLRKPPFRFLHDVINVVIQETGYLNGVYTADELVYENVKEKDAKIQFLQKLIDAVKASATDGGATLKVRSSRIVAGHEPERTNELLQAIGMALEDGRTGTNAPSESKSKKESKKSKITVPPAGDTKINGKRATSKLPLSSKPATDPNNNGQVNKSSKNVAKEDKTQKTTKTVKTPLTLSNNIKENSSKSKQKLVKTKSKDQSDHMPEISTADTHITDADDSHTEVAHQQIIDVNHPEIPQQIDEIPIGVPLSINMNELLSESPVVPALITDTDKMITAPSSNTPTKIASAISGSNSELIDVIDQEAELRRREGSERKQKRGTSGHNQAAADQELAPSQHELVAAAPLEMTLKTPEKLSKSSKKSHRSGRNRTDANEQSNAVTAASASPATDQADSTDVRSPAAQPPPPPPALVRPRTSLRPPSVRPASARPGAPRRRERNVEVFLPPSETATGQVADSSANAFSLDLDDDGDTLIVIEDAALAISNDDQPTIGAGTESGASIALADSSVQGHLVQQILQTQKELAKGDAPVSGTDAETDFNTLHQRQSSAKQMDTLRDSIQQLTRSVHPLGKLMDFLQEDIDAMQMELQMWSGNYATAKAELGRERSENESALVPLQQQLEQIDDAIREQIALSHASRRNILQNEDKLLRLLGDL